MSQPLSYYPSPNDSAHYLGEFIKYPLEQINVAESPGTWHNQCNCSSCVFWCYGRTCNDPFYLPMKERFKYYIIDRQPFDRSSILLDNVRQIHVHVDRRDAPDYEVEFNFIIDCTDMADYVLVYHCQEIKKRIEEYQAAKTRGCSTDDSYFEMDAEYDKKVMVLKLDITF
jgi:hypothetical protein